MTALSTLKAPRGLRPVDPACPVCVWTEWPPAPRSTVSPPVWIRSTYRVNAAQFAQVRHVYNHTRSFISGMYFLLNSLMCYCLGRLCVWRPCVQSRRDFLPIGWPLSDLHLWGTAHHCSLCTCAGLISSRWVCVLQVMPDGEQHMRCYRKQCPSLVNCPKHNILYSSSDACCPVCARQY